MQLDPDAASVAGAHPDEGQPRLDRGAAYAYLSWVRTATSLSGPRSVVSHRWTASSSTRQPADERQDSTRARASGTALAARFALPVIMLGPLMYWCPSPDVPPPHGPAPAARPMLRRPQRNPQAFADALPKVDPSAEPRHTVAGRIT